MPTVLRERGSRSEGHSSNHAVTAEGGGGWGGWREV